MWFALILLSARAYADCGAAPTLPDLVDLARRARLDGDAGTLLATRLACLREPLDRLDAVLLHHGLAMAAWQRRDGPVLAAELRAVQALDPAWRPPGTMLAAWTAMPPAEAGGSLPWEGLVDGEAGPLPLDRATIAQRLENGEWETRLLVPMVEPPAGLAVPAERTRRVPTPVHVRITPKPHVAPLVVGAGLGVASLVAFGMSVAWTEEFHDLDNPAVRTEADLVDLGNRANAMSGASFGLGVLSLGCFGGAFVTFEVR